MSELVLDRFLGLLLYLILPVFVGVSSPMGSPMGCSHSCSFVLLPRFFSLNIAFVRGTEAQLRSEFIMPDQG